MSQQPTTSPVVRVIAIAGIVLLNAGAAFLIVSALSNSTTFGVASVLVSLAAVVVDVIGVRGLLSMRRSAR